MCLAKERVLFGSGFWWLWGPDSIPVRIPDWQHGGEPGEEQETGCIPKRHVPEARSPRPPSLVAETEHLVRATEGRKAQLELTVGRPRSWCQRRCDGKSVKRLVRLHLQSGSQERCELVLNFVFIQSRTQVPVTFKIGLQFSRSGNTLKDTDRDVFPWWFKSH